MYDKGIQLEHRGLKRRTIVPRALPVAHERIQCTYDARMLNRPNHLLDTFPLLYGIFRMRPDRTTTQQVTRSPEHV